MHMRMHVNAQMCLERALASAWRGWSSRIPLEGAPGIHFEVRVTITPWCQVQRTLMRACMHLKQWIPPAGCSLPVTSTTSMCLHAEFL